MRPRPEKVQIQVNRDRRSGLFRFRFSPVSVFFWSIGLDLETLDVSEAGTESSKPMSRQGGEIIDYLLAHISILGNYCIRRYRAHVHETRACFAEVPCSRLEEFQVILDRMLIALKSQLLEPLFLPQFCMCRLGFRKV